MSQATTTTIRPVGELDLGAIEAIDEKITGQYRPEHWETQIQYYISRAPESALVAEESGEVIGFLFGDIRGWEFGFDQPTGWVEVVGIHPDHQGKKIAGALVEALFGHWRKRGVTSARTLVDNSDAKLSGFMTHLGMQPSPVTPYEMAL